MTKWRGEPRVGEKPTVVATRPIAELKAAKAKRPKDPKVATTPTGDNERIRVQKRKHIWTQADEAAAKARDEEMRNVGDRLRGVMKVDGDRPHHPPPISDFIF